MTKVDIRLTGILIENNKILLLKQNTGISRSWTLPGGKLEFGETIEAGIIREMKEETGLNIIIEKMLYITDFFPAKEKHIVHISFLVKAIDRNLGEILDIDTNKIDLVEFVDIKKLKEYGFSNKFIDLCLSSFKDSGKYLGDKKNIGL